MDQDFVKRFLRESLDLTVKERILIVLGFYCDSIVEKIEAKGHELSEKAKEVQVAE